MQAYILQSSRFSKRKFLNLKHFKRLSTDTVKIKVKDVAAKETRKIKKIKNNEFQRLFMLAAPEKWRLVGAITFLFISSTITMAVPFCLGKVIDIIYQKDQKDTKENLNRVCLALLGIFIFGGLCNFTRVYLMSTTGHKITQSLRKKAYAAILSQETAMFDKVSTGELVGRLSGNNFFNYNNFFILFKKYCAALSLKYFKFMIVQHHTIFYELIRVVKNNNIIMKYKFNRFQYIN